MSVKTKYEPLIEFLKNCIPGCTKIKLTLKQIEIILHSDLPYSARTYEQWWHGRDRPWVQKWEMLGWKAKPHYVGGDITWVSFIRKLTDLEKLREVLDGEIKGNMMVPLSWLSELIGLDPSFIILALKNSSFKDYEVIFKEGKNWIKRRS